MYLTVNARVEVHPDTLVEIIKEEVERVFSAVGYKQEKLLTQFYPLEDQILHLDIEKSLL